MDTKNPRLIGLAVALAFSFSFMLISVPVAEAAPEPTSDLLLPYFEVQLDSPGLTTLFSVVNTSDEPVPVIFGIYSNWGVEILQVPQVLAPHQSQSVNLRDWLVNGVLPDGIQLEASKIAHVQAALCGEESPEDGLYYSTEIQAQRAVGYVTVRAQGSPRPDVLFGDYFVVDPRENFAQGERLINIDPLDPCGNGLCERHALRFLEGGGFDGGTELIVWTPGRIQPEEGPVLGSMASVLLDTNAFEEPGVFLGQRDVNTLPVQVVRVSELGFDKNFGWLEMVTEERSFVGVRYSANQRFSVGLVSTCLPVEFPPGAGLRIEKSTNGVDADRKPGPSIAVGEAIVWEYIVTNTGDVEITGITVSDDDESLNVVCPKTTLAAGESMICKAEGEAQACDYVNTGTAQGLADGFGSIFDSDLSHYFGNQAASISLDLTVNGEQAAQAPGIPVQVGDTLDFSYLVTNTGDAALTDVVVFDGDGNEVACPKSALGPGQSMTCTSQGTLGSGVHQATAKARGKDSCGAEAAAADDVHFDCECVEPPASISIEKATNGHDADSWASAPEMSPGQAITWTYVVTNDGEAALHDVSVADDDNSLSLSCPKTALEAGESMTCTAHGTAGDHSYQNIGLVTALSECDAAVLDTDPSHYTVGDVCDDSIAAAVSIETRVGGSDADSSPGVAVDAGDTLDWEYVVTNMADDLVDVEVTDSLGLAIFCPSDTLASGASMTCTAQSTAAAGTHSNTGMVSAHTGDAAECRKSASSADPAWYTGEEEVGLQGCTPGYWKNHTDSWPATGYTPSQSVDSVFAASSAYSGVASATLHQALSFGGGPTVEDAARNLMRAAVAGLLDSAHPGVDYPRATAALIADVDAALASGDRDTILGLAAAIDADNNLGCPLN